jgi:hypothetical protein
MRVNKTSPIARRSVSILGQRFVTTFTPSAGALAAAASLRTPSCIQITQGLGFEPVSISRRAWVIMAAAPAGVIGLKRANRMAAMRSARAARLN